MTSEISKKMHFLEFRDSSAQNKTSGISKNDFQELWDSCAQNKTTDISTNDCQEFLDSCVQNKTSESSTKCTFKNSGTPVRRTKRRKSQHNALLGILGLLSAEQNVGNLKTCTFKNSGILALQLPDMRDTGSPAAGYMRDTGSPTAGYEGCWHSSCRAYEGYWLSSCQF